MQVIFWISWVINSLILLVCSYETFMVSSNRSLLMPVLIFLTILVASLWLRSDHPKLAFYISVIPASLVLAAVIIWFLMMISNNKWQ